MHVMDLVSVQCYSQQVELPRPPIPYDSPWGGGSEALSWALAVAQHPTQHAPARPLARALRLQRGRPATRPEEQWEEQREQRDQPQQQAVAGLHRTEGGQRQQAAKLPTSGREGARHHDPCPDSSRGTA
eukprot:gene12091-biopygen9879